MPMLATAIIYHLSEDIRRNDFRYSSFLNRGGILFSCGYKNEKCTK